MLVRERAEVQEVPPRRGRARRRDGGDRARVSPWAAAGRGVAAACRAGRDRATGLRLERPAPRAGPGREDARRARAAAPGACRAAARVLRVAGEAVRPGITTDALDEIAHAETLRLGGYPSPLNYRGFPKSICTSVNEVICHGIPDSRPLEDGDIVNLDITVFLDGMHGDCSATFLVGEVDPDGRRLVQVARECLAKGISAVRPGRPISDIGHAIEAHASRHGYGVGARVLRPRHRRDVPHLAPDPAPLRPVGAAHHGEGDDVHHRADDHGGTWQDLLWDDGWTAITADGKRSAQFEHTIAVNDDGAEILTVEA